MQLKKLVVAMPVALALSIPAVGAISIAPSQAATVHMATMTMTKKGTFEKRISSTSFKMSEGMKSYTVKTNDMTHVTLGSKKVKLTSLKKGDTVTVKGELEMGTIMATSVGAGM